MKRETKSIEVKEIAEQVIAMFERLGDRAKCFVETIALAVCRFVDFIGATFDFLAGKDSFVYESINTNTNKLRIIASRLQAVQNRIRNVDRNLNHLRDNMEWYEVLDNIRASLIDLIAVGYDQDLKKCIDYLNLAANELESCENKLVIAAKSL